MTNATALDAVRDVTIFADNMSYLIKRMDDLQESLRGDDNFTMIYNKLRDRIGVIAASMESLEKDGINQDTVNALCVALPGMMPDIPIGSYTTIKSDINLGSAMEALGEGKLKTVGAAIYSGFAIIIKIVTWFINFMKDYVKRRKMPALVGLNTIKAIDEYAPPKVPNDSLLTIMKKSREYTNLAQGFDWLVSMTQHPDAIYTFSDNAMIEWWPEIANELVYEYDQLKKAYAALLNRDFFLPNIAPVRMSPAIHRFYLAMPHGVNKSGKPVTREEADKMYQKDPFGAMVATGEHLRYMLMLPSTIKDRDMVEMAVALAGSMETYNAADRLVFDSLASTEVSATMNALNKGFSALYKDMQSRQHEASIADVDEFVKYVNWYSEKLNCFTQLVTCVFFIDSSAVSKIGQLSEFMLRYIQTNENNPS